MNYTWLTGFAMGLGFWIILVCGLMTAGELGLI